MSIPSKAQLFAVTEFMPGEFLHYYETSGSYNSRLNNTLYKNFAFGLQLFQSDNVYHQLSFSKIGEYEIYGIHTDHWGKFIDSFSVFTTGTSISYRTGLTNILARRTGVFLDLTFGRSNTVVPSNTFNRLVDLSKAANTEPPVTDPNNNPSSFIGFSVGMSYSKWIFKDLAFTLNIPYTLRIQIGQKPEELIAEATSKTPKTYFGGAFFNPGISLSYKIR
jgi:hypothetical protein